MTKTWMLMWAPSLIMRRYSWRPVQAEICMNRRCPIMQIWARFRFWPLATIRLEHITSTSYVEGSCDIRIEYYNFDDLQDEGLLRLQATTGSEAQQFIGELRHAITDAHVFRNVLLN